MAGVMEAEPWPEGWPAEKRAELRRGMGYGPAGGDALDGIAIEPPEGWPGEPPAVGCYHSWEVWNETYLHCARCGGIIGLPHVLFGMEPQLWD